MERLIMSPEFDVAEADVDYVSAILDQVYDQPQGTAAAVAVENDPWGDPRCEVSVRRFRDPKIGLIRWALLVDGDDLELRDYPNKAEAMSAYRTFVRKCAAEGVIWATADAVKI